MYLGQKGLLLDIICPSAAMWHWSLPHLWPKNGCCIVAAGSFRAADWPICGGKFHSCELIDQVRVKWCAGAAIGDRWLQAAFVERTRFSQAAVTVGYANGLLTDWRQNCHFSGQYSRDDQRMIHCETIFLWNSRAELDINAGRAHEREVQEQSATNWQSLSLRGNSDYALEVNFIWN